MKGLIFTYALTYGGAILSLFNPFVGLLIYICFAIVRPESMWHFSVPQGGRYSYIVAIGLFIGWAVNGMGKWNLGRAWGIVGSLVAYLGWATLSMFFVASRKEFAWDTYIEPLIKTVLPFLVGISLVDSVPKLKMLAWTIALSQGYVAYELNLAYYQGYNRVTDAGFGGMDNNCVAIAMCTGAGLAFFLGLGEPKWWKKLAAFAVAGLMAHTVMFSMSRGGMLGLIIAGGVSFFLIPKKPVHYMWFGVAVIAGLILAGPSVRNEFSTVFLDAEERDASASSRITMWTNCVQVMLSNPLLGVGPSHWTIVAPDFGWVMGKEAHTLWLQVGAELGVPGLTFLLLFYGLCAWRLLPLALAKNAPVDPFLTDVARMFIAAIAGFTISAQFVSLEGLELPYYVTLVGAGALKLVSLQQASMAQAQAAWSSVAPSQWSFAGLGRGA
jgi:O-antigen ligase